MAAVTRTLQQDQALYKAARWYETPNTDPVFRLHGSAGTGKTTVAKDIAAALGVADNTTYCAFTGKAVNVLRDKGCEGARTIHSLIYMPKVGVKKRLDELQACLDATPASNKAAVKELAKAIAVEKQKLDTPFFAKREVSDIQNSDLLIIDEASMVDGPTAEDIASFGIKTIALGDPMQLPPIRGKSTLLGDRPDHLLTEIHRSALTSPVTRIGIAIRNSTPRTPGYGVIGLDGDSGRTDHIAPRDLLDYDQVLCGTNKTRWNLITVIRGLAGRIGPKPKPGDRIMFTCNNPTYDVFNGQQALVVACTRADSPAQYDLEVTYDDGTAGVVTVWAEGFTGFEGEKNASRQGRGDVAAATFANAVTVHKSQGSQWDHVLVVDESDVFVRGGVREGVDAGLGHYRSLDRAHLIGKRWLYTAATRAAVRVIITGKRVTT